MYTDFLCIDPMDVGKQPTYVYIHTCMHAYMHTYIHVTHAYMHTYIHVTIYADWRLRLMCIDPMDVERQLTRRHSLHNVQLGERTQVTHAYI